MVGKCIYCEADVHIPLAYFRWLWALTLSIVIILGMITYRATGTWLLVLLLVALPIRWILEILIPPWLEPGTSRYQASFAILYVTYLMVLLFELICLGAANFLIGATRSDVREWAQTMSAPLGLINPAFWLTSAHDFADWCGIFLANNLVITTVVYFLYRVMNLVRRRGEFARMNLNSDKNSNDELL